MKKILTSLVLAAFGATTLFGASVKALKPENRSVVAPLTTMQRMVNTLSMEQLEVLWKDKIFMHRVNACPNASLPQGVEFKWEYSSKDSLKFKVLLADNAELQDAWTYDEEDTGFTLHNLIPGKTYFWKVVAVKEDGEAAAESKVSSFTVENLLPRVIYAPEIKNFRDLGGMKAMGGRAISFGKLYRSGSLNANSEDGQAAGEAYLTEEGQDVMVNELQIKTELDLRWEREAGKEAGSLLGADVNYINIPAKLYGAMFTAAGQENYAKIFQLFAKAENYPVAFHCIAGADRTGCLAFLLEAVLGCSEEDIRRDYIFSSFYSARYFSAIDVLIAGMDAYGVAGDDTLQSKAERYLLRGGVTPEEILSFQKIVLGDDVTPSPVLKTALEISALKAQFPEKASLKMVESSPVKGTMLQCGKEYAFTPPVWGKNPVVFVGADGKGDFLFEIDNMTQDVCYGCFQGEDLTAERYFLLNALTKEAFLNANGNIAWKAEELLGEPIPLPAASQMLLVLQPAGEALPEGYAKKVLEVQDDKFLMASSAKPAPVIDGVLDDEMWMARAPFALCAVDGTPVKDNHAMIYLGTDPQHTMLYMAVKVEDDSFNAQERPRDGECWADDEVEFFISGVGDVAYYQLVFNRVGSWLDGKGQDVSLSLNDVVAKTGEVEGGWVLEVALPMEQLQLTNAIELNVCTTNVPSGIQRNLGPTGGVYHTREALKPILLK